MGHTFSLTPVGVFFGRDGGQAPGLTVPDLDFGGAGPERTGCTECGSCMTGCRVGAKNTLVKNYLHLAEQAGTQVFPETTVVAVRPLPTGGYSVDTVRTGSWSKRPTRSFTAGQVVLAAGTLGTQRLLHRMRDTGTLPNVSPRLGMLTRTNSESLLGAQTRSVKRGLPPRGRDHLVVPPDAETHVEPVRYGRGSNLMGLLQTVMTDGGGRVPRWVKALTRSCAARHLRAHPDPAPLVRTHDHHLGDADQGQLARPRSPAGSAQRQAGTRGTEPDLDPCWQRGNPTRRDEDRRLPRGHHRRAREHPDDRSLPRRMRDRRLAQARA